MDRRLAGLILPFTFILAPFSLAPERLAHPAVALALVSAAVVMLTQPPLSPADLARMTGPDRGSALAILVAGLVQVMACMGELALATSPPSPFSGPVVAGLALSAAGLWLRVHSIRLLGQAFTSQVATSAEQTLVQEGPYRWVRHPSYSGMLVVYVGVALAAGSLVGLALTVLLVTPVYVYRVQVEEAALVERFGARYQAYQLRTKRLVPFVA